MHIPEEKDVIDKLVAWGTAHPLIRAMILTSSRTRPDGPVDLLSDYDLILAVSEVRRSPLRCRGSPTMASQWCVGATKARCTVWPRIFGAWSIRIMSRSITASGRWNCWRASKPRAILPDQLDVGYRVLLDKDRRTAGWKQPSYQAHIPARPTEADYLALVEEFWWSTTYVAKSLWRDDLVFARWVLDQDLKLETVRRMLEWRIEIDHNWSVKPGVYGRGLKQLLPPDLWSELTSTYASLDVEETWAALDRVIVLFRRVALHVGNVLGYTYPQQVDDQVSSYLEAIREMPSPH